MNRRNPIKDELNGLNSQLPQDPDGSPYSVPEGYFEGLAGSILSRIKTGSPEVSPATEIAELSPLLAGLSREMPYAVPGNYFSSTIDGLSILVREDETPAVLKYIGKELPYEVPYDYFEELPSVILKKVTNRGRVVPMIRRKWMHLAAAALVAGIITLSGISYFNKPSVDPNAPIAQQLKNVSTKELDEFINNTTVTTEARARTTEVKHLLQDVSVNDLEAFLEEVPTEEEEILIN